MGGGGTIVMLCLGIFDLRRVTGGDWTTVTMNCVRVFDVTEMTGEGENTFILNCVGVFDLRQWLLAVGLQTVLVACA